MFWNMWVFSLPVIGLEPQLLWYASYLIEEKYFSQKRKDKGCGRLLKLHSRSQIQQQNYHHHLQVVPSPSRSPISRAMSRNVIEILIPNSRTLGIDNVPTALFSQCILRSSPYRFPSVVFSSSQLHRQRFLMLFSLSTFVASSSPFAYFMMSKQIGRTTRNGGLRSIT